MEHPAVAEAGVIGKPDPIAGRDREGLRRAEARLHGRADELERELLGFVRKRLGTAVAPKEIAFLPLAAQDPQRQDHAPPAQGARARAAGRRYLHAGGRRMSQASVEPDASVVITRYRASRCCAQMIRIRRFEEKCAELYSAGKIRGFLHLYIGEEAVAAGVMPALTRDDAVVATYREHGHALARGLTRREHHGRDVRQAGRLQPRPRRLDASVRRDATLLRGQCHRRRRAAAGGGTGPGRQDAEAQPRDRLLFRRGRRRGRRVPRVA